MHKQIHGSSKCTHQAAHIPRWEQVEDDEMGNLNFKHFAEDKRNSWRSLQVNLQVQLTIMFYMIYLASVYESYNLHSGPMKTGKSL